MMKQSVAVTLGLAALVVLAGCRGMRSEDPPIHPNLNMDFQEKFEAQEANPFFADGAAMRTPVPGTVPRGLLREDTEFYLGRTENGAFVEEMPVPATRELLIRGRERYDIYCSVCHGRSGDGQGIIMTGNYGYTPATSYHNERVREAADGYLYDVITNGVRNMPGYAQQVPVADRWAIVAYVRALQRSQNATEADIPPSVLARIEQGSSANINAARMGTGGGGAGADTTAQGEGGNATMQEGAQGTTEAGDTTEADVPPADTAQTDVAEAGTTPPASESAPAGTTATDTTTADTTAQGEGEATDDADAAARDDATEGGAQPDTAQQGAAAQADTAQGGADTAQGGTGNGDVTGAASPDQAAAPTSEAAAAPGERLDVFTMIMLGVGALVLVGLVIMVFALGRRSKKREAVEHANP